MSRILITLSFLGFIVMSTTARAQTSEGCTTINSVAPDFVVSTLTVSVDNAFVSGDRVTADVRGGPGNATDAEVRVDGSIVDSTSLPGTLSYDIPADGNYVLVFQALGGSSLDSTWNFNCTSQSPRPVAVPAMPLWLLMLMAAIMSGIASSRIKQKNETNLFEKSAGTLVIRSPL